MYNKNNNHNLDNTKKYSSQICTQFKKKKKNHAGKTTFVY